VILNDDGMVTAMGQGALKYIAENMPVSIFDDELIFGRPNTWLGRHTLVYPELDGSIMKQGGRDVHLRGAAGKADAVRLTAALRRIAQKE
jgi:formate C-acetyltransferase